MATGENHSASVVEDDAAQPQAQRRRREEKARIATRLFGDWFSEEGAGDAVSALSYNPGRDQQPDVLTGEHSRNADIFSNQRWAAKRAHEVFAEVRRDPALFEGLKVPAEHAGGKDTYDKFLLTIVGSSVTGLTFHAVLHFLFREWNNAGQGPRLDDVVTFEFLDSHLRPLQRLLQARDRSITPRFEYERLLTADVSGAAELPALYEAGEAPLLAAWNETETLSDATAIEDNIAALRAALGDACPEHLYIPKAMCWPAGDVRLVAAHIEEGYRALTQGLHHFPDTLGAMSCGSSPTGGPIYKGVSPVEGKQNVGRGATYRLNVNVLGVFDNRSSFYADHVLLATGPGIDISPSEVPDGVDPLTLNDVMANSQNTYWNTPKIELDLKEARDISVLVLGNSDSAAGTVYSTLFNDPLGCSHRFLRRALAPGSHLRGWFTELQRLVGPVPTGRSTTNHWQARLSDASVLEHLYGFATFDEDSSAIHRDQDMVEAQLRISVKVGLSLQDGRDPFLVDGLSEPPPFMRVESSGETLPSSDRLRTRLFRGAWPENRIVMAMLHDKIEIYQHRAQAGSPPEIQPILHEGEALQRRNFVVPVYKIEHTSEVVRGQVQASELTFKYVFDCRGATYFTFTGNALVSNT